MLALGLASLKIPLNVLVLVSAIVFQFPLDGTSDEFLSLLLQIPEHPIPEVLRLVLQIPNCPIPGSSKTYFQSGQVPPTYAYPEVGDFVCTSVIQPT